MEIWLDSCSREAVRAACKYNFIYGITTNPSLLSRTKEDPRALICDLLELQNGPVAVQVISLDCEEMVLQALALNALSSRIIVKIPVTQQGLAAMKALAQEHVPVMATAVFQPNQALLAALAGADYVAPYLGRMLDAGIEAHTALQSMQTIYQQYGFKTKILAAAIKTPEQITACAEIGIPAITLKSTLFEQFLCDDPCTLDSLQTFAEDWQANYSPEVPLTS